MKCAIVHDSLLEYGGAEHVLDSLLKIFPDADIYTLVAKNSIISKYYSQTKNTNFKIILPERINYKISFIQMISPLIWRNLKLEHYDLVIANSSNLMSNIAVLNNPINIQYILTPPKNIFGLVEKYRIQKIFDYSVLIKPYFINAISKATCLLTDSFYIRRILKNKFNVSANVIYPPVKIPLKMPQKSEGKYFLSVSRITKSKNLDIIIEVCNNLKIPLKIVGCGNEPVYENKLKKIASPLVEFLGFIDERILKSMYLSAKALICASENEDFGISAVEAQAYGLPVIALNSGGFKETILEGKTGIFYKEKTVKSLMNALRRFSRFRYDPKECYLNSLKFTEERFMNSFKIYATSVISASKKKRSN